MLSPVLLLLLLFGGDLVGLLYGPQYASYGLVVRIYTLVVFVGALDFWVSRGLMAAGRADLEFAGTVVLATAAVIGGPLLIWHFGPLGVALGLLLAFSLGAVAACHQFCILTGPTAIHADEVPLTGPVGDSHAPPTFSLSENTVPA